MEIQDEQEKINRYQCQAPGGRHGSDISCRPTKDSIGADSVVAAGSWAQYNSATADGSVLDPGGDRQDVIGHDLKAVVGDRLTRKVNHA
jgi:hypothetical protein